MVAIGIPLDKAKEHIRGMIGQLRIIEQSGCVKDAELGDMRILIKELQEVLRILPVEFPSSINEV